MELIKKPINTCNTIAKGTAQAMADGDVIVPDTKPDILKLLQVDSEASITDKYIENGRLVLCGRVDYKVLYIPDSESEKIKSILTSMEFRQVVDARNTDADVQILAKPIVERVEFNTVNSRKLRLRAIIHIDYEICCLRVAEVTYDTENEQTEKKMESVLYENTVNISEHEFTIKEKLEIPSGEASIKEMLKNDIKICDTEYKPLTGKVIIKGVACICVLYVNESDEIKFTEIESPFTEVIDADGVTEDSVCDIDYCVIGAICNAEPDIDGDLRDIILDIDICAALKATETAEMDVLKDCFIPYHKTECVKNTLPLHFTAERPTLQNTLRDTIEIPQNAPGVSGVYNIMTNASITKSDQQRNKIVCEGKVEAYVLYLTDTHDNPIYSIKKEIPFSYMIECKNETEALDCEMKCLIKHASYNLNSSGEIEIRCLLAIDCMLSKPVLVENIDSIKTDECERRKGIVIYFANAGERVWDIAKNYAVPCKMLAEYNEICEDKLETERKIFIPVN